MMSEYFVVEGKKFVPEAVVPPVDPSIELYELLGDESLAMFNYKSRTYGLPNKCTPSVMRFEKTAQEPKNDYRVDVSPLMLDYLILNYETNIEDPKSRYLFADDTALFNSTGYPQQAYITMQGNKLKMIAIEGVYLKFETLKPASDVAGMTFVTHPWFVHRFDLVCWDTNDKPNVTSHKPQTPQGIIDYFLVTKEGYGYIPLDRVAKVTG